jgi:hypothetical protein
VPLLDSVRDEFADRNVALHVVLGAISLAQRLDALVPKRPAPHASNEPEEPAASKPRMAREPGDPLLDFVLGLIALRRALMAELEPIRAAHASAEQPRPAGPRKNDAPPLRLRELLR